MGGRAGGVVIAFAVALYAALTGVAAHLLAPEPPAIALVAPAGPLVAQAATPPALHTAR